MEAVADEIERAKKRIFIADWQLSPCIYLKRPFNGKDYIPDDHWRLDHLLK